jgi:hypothetical protein
MAVTHTTAVRNAMADWLLAQLDAGGPGKLAFRLAGTADAPGAVAATLTLAATAFGATSAGVATAGTIASDTNAAGNASPVANATLQTAAGVVKVHCAVAASASDINMSGGLVIANGDTVAMSGLTYTAPP